MIRNRLVSLKYSLLGQLIVLILVFTNRFKVAFLGHVTKLLSGNLLRDIADPLGFLGCDAVIVFQRITQTDGFTFLSGLLDFFFGRLIASLRMRMTKTAI